MLWAEIMTTAGDTRSNSAGISAEHPGRAAWTHAPSAVIARAVPRRTSRRAMGVIVAASKRRTLIFHSEVNCSPRADDYRYKMLPNAGVHCPVDRTAAADEPHPPRFTLRMAA